MGTLAPEVKRLTLSQRLNGKNGHQSCLPVRVFAFFGDVSRSKRCSAMSRNMYIFYPGDSHMKGAGMLVGNFEKLQKETNLGVGQPFLIPERGHFATRDHFVTIFFC